MVTALDSDMDLELPGPLSSKAFAHPLCPMLQTASDFSSIATNVLGSFGAPKQTACGMQIAGSWIEGFRHRDFQVQIGTSAAS